MKVTRSILLASLMLSFYACKNENSKIDSLVPSQSLAAYECYFFLLPVAQHQETIFLKFLNYQKNISL